jgi:predicted aspartyl protease
MRTASAFCWARGLGIRRHRRVALGEWSSSVLPVVVILFAPLSIFAADKHRSAAQLPGYTAVRVHYAPMNKMIMPVHINGHPANLLVDTGASQIILDNDIAELAGVRPFQRAISQFHFSAPTQVFNMGSEINGKILPVGVAHDITAGNMNFGSNPVALRESVHSGSGRRDVDGVLGLDILFRHKALINCRTKLVFFRLDQVQHINLGPFEDSEKYARVPIERTDTGALTVPCSIHGQPARLLVDTGAFVTILHEGFIKSLAIPVEATRITAQFGGAPSKRVDAAKMNDLRIGTFRMPSEKIGVAPLPRFALQQGDTKIAGILGMDTLYLCNAIIDLGGMNLFLK